MHSTTITPQRFDAVIAAIPDGSAGMGFQRGDVSYSAAGESSGVYKGEPYTKPAQIQIGAGDKRYRIERASPALRFLYDPTGGFNLVPLVDPAALRDLEGHFADLERHLGIIRAQREAAAATPPAAAPRDVDAFIAALLHGFPARQRRKVQHATRMALTAPLAYLRRHRKALAARGIHSPVPHLYVIALVDGLQGIGAAAEIDWNAEVETLFHHVSRLASRRGVSLAPLDDGATSEVRELLRTLGQELAAQGHVLAAIDIGADAIVLLVVAQPGWAKSRALAERAGIEIHTL